MLHNVINDFVSPHTPPTLTEDIPYITCLHNNMDILHTTDSINNQRHLTDCSNQLHSITTFTSTLVHFLSFSSFLMLFVSIILILFYGITQSPRGGFYFE